MEKEKIQNNSIEPRTKRENKVNKYYLGLEELNKIIDATESLRDRVILKILVRTGVRRFEFSSIKKKFLIKCSI